MLTYVVLDRPHGHPRAYQARGVDVGEVRVSEEAPSTTTSNGDPHSERQAVVCKVPPRQLRVAVIVKDENHMHRGKPMLVHHPLDFSGEYWVVLPSASHAHLVRVRQLSPPALALGRRACVRSQIRRNRAATVFRMFVVIVLVMLVVPRVGCRVGFRVGLTVPLIEARPPHSC